MPSTSKLRVGVIGAGQFAQVCHIPGLRSHGDAEVAAIAARRPDAARQVADAFGIPAVYDDYRALCLDPAIDAVTIATPNVAHAEQAIFALDHGKHVFCEKPLGVTVAEAEQMLAAAERSGRVHMVAFTYRYCYGVQALRARVIDGSIGRPHYLRIQYDSWEGLDPSWRIGWRESLAEAGGGLLFDRGSHLFDLSRYLLGPLERVTGFHYLVAERQHPTQSNGLRDVETDDIAASWFAHTSGARGQWFVSRATPPFAANSFVQVVGEDGALQAAISRGSVDLLQASTPAASAWTDVPLPAGAYDARPHALERMMHSFVDACRRGTAAEGVDATFHDGLAVQQAIDAVVRAADRHVWIRLAT